MPCFNVSRRFRVISERVSGRKVVKPVVLENIETLNSIDDSVLSYMVESIVRELADKGILENQIREKLYGHEVVLSDRELPAVSLGPSGIKGCYQSEL